MFKAVRPRKTIRFSSRSCETAPSRATCSALPLSRAETRFSAAVRAVLSAFWLTTEDRLVTVDLSAFRPACSARARSAPSILALSELKSTRSTLSAASHWESP